MTRLTLVVSGFSEMGEALENTGYFETIHSISSTSELRELTRAHVLPDGSRVLFIFADTTVEDTAPQSLEILVQKLTMAGHRVILMGLSGRAKFMVSSTPAAGLLEPPFTTNIMLAAISGISGVSLDPVQGGFDTIEPGRGRTPTPPAGTPLVDVQAPNVEPARTPQPEPPVSSVADGSWTRPGAGEPSVTPEQPRPITPPRTAPSPPRLAPQKPATPPPFQGGGTTPATPVRPSPAETGPVRAVPVIARPLAPRQVSVVRPGGAGAVSYPDFAPSTQSLQRRASVIVITSPKGGTGKSTLSLNLAAYMALRVKSLGKRVCIIDANFQQGDVGKMLGSFDPTVSNLLRDPSSLSPNGIMRYLVTRDDLNLSALLGPAIPEEANPNYLTPRLYSQILDALRPNFDYIFIDTPVAERYHDMFQDFLLPAADFIILPVTPVMHTILNANSWLELVTQPEHMNGNGVDPNRVGYVINQVEEGIEFDENKVRRELGHWRYLGSIPRSKAWINAVNNAELVATRNYVELNRAFSQILWYATGEDVLRYDPSMTAVAGGKSGIIKRLLGRS